MRAGANPDLSDIMGFVCLIVGVVLVVVLVIAIFYLLTLQKALSRVSPRNRTMEPGMVWLMLIPCVNIVWQFFVAIRVPESLRNEFRDRGRDDGSDYGKGIALTRAILNVVSMLIGQGMRAAQLAHGVGNDMRAAAGPEEGMAQVGSCISGILSLISLVLFIVFWVKVANYSSQLAQDDYRDDYRRPFDEYDDRDRDFPRDRPGPPPDTYRPEDPGQYH
jgi:hypothetical protein